jgi:hypothetical protein
MSIVSTCTRMPFRPQIISYPINWLHGAESFFRSEQPCNWSVNSHTVWNLMVCDCICTGLRIVPNLCRMIESTSSHRISLTSVLWAVFSHLCLGLPSGLFRFPHLDHVYISLIITHTSFRNPHSSFGHHNNIRWGVEIWNLPCSFLQSPTSSLLGQNMFLITLFLNTYSPYSSLTSGDVVLHP